MRLEHISYDCQLIEKRENVISQLVRTAGIDEEKARSLVRDTVPSEAYHGISQRVSNSAAAAMREADSS